MIHSTAFTLPTFQKKLKQSTTSSFYDNNYTGGTYI